MILGGLPPPRPPASPWGQTPRSWGCRGSNTLGCPILLPVPGPSFRRRFWVCFGREPDPKFASGFRPKLTQKRPVKPGDRKQRFVGKSKVWNLPPPGRGPGLPHIGPRPKLTQNRPVTPGDRKQRLVGKSKSWSLPPRGRGPPPNRVGLAWCVSGDSVGHGSS